MLINANAKLVKFVECEANNQNHSCRSLLSTSSITHARSAFVYSRKGKATLMLLLETRQELAKKYKAIPNQNCGLESRAGVSEEGHSCVAWRVDCRDLSAIHPEQFGVTKS